MTPRVLLLLGIALGAAARAETLEVPPKATGTIAPIVSPAPSTKVPSSTPAAPAIPVVQASPLVVQSEQLAILQQERRALVARLAEAMNAEGKAGAPLDNPDRIRRAQEDVQGIDREIARAAKAPPPPIRNSTPGATAPVGSVARATATTTASAVNPTPQPTASEPAYEGWDVFKNFGKQGATQ